MRSEKTEYSLPTLPADQTVSGKNRQPFAVAADSFTGLVRRRNEDSYLYSWDPSGRYLLIAVADGIGSTRNGDAASCYALQQLIQFWKELVFPNQRLQNFIRDFLESSFCEINRRFYEINQVTLELSERDSLGTTMTAAVFLPDVVIAANAGDSPLFRIRDGKIRQLTFDHNLANEVVRSGQMSKEEAAALPGGHMLTRFIGPKDLVEPECYTANIRTGDRFLLCSDGLTLHIPPDEICTILEQKKNISEAIKVLFRRTFLRGAMDNSTGILVQAL